MSRIAAATKPFIISYLMFKSLFSIDKKTRKKCRGWSIVYNCNLIPTELFECFFDINAAIKGF